MSFPFNSNIAISKKNFFLCMSFPFNSNIAISKKYIIYLFFFFSSSICFICTTCASICIISFLFLIFLCFSLLLVELINILQYKYTFSPHLCISKNNKSVIKTKYTTSPSFWNKFCDDFWQQTLSFASLDSIRIYILSDCHRHLHVAACCTHCQKPVYNLIFGMPVFLYLQINEGVCDMHTHFTFCLQKFEVHPFYIWRFI